MEIWEAILLTVAGYGAARVLDCLFGVTDQVSKWLKRLVLNVD